MNSSNPKNHFEEILKRSLEIHIKKRSDYTTNPDANKFENFERSNEIASWFPPEYKSFAVLIGTKLARLSALLSSEREPNNESIDDSFLDLITYCGLMYEFYKKNQPEECKHDVVYEGGTCRSCGQIIQLFNYKHDLMSNLYYRVP